MKRIKYMSDFNESLKPINSFESRSGVKPHFDQGDVVTDGENMTLVLNITTSSDGKAYYLVIPRGGLNDKLEYHLFNKTHTLVKKGDEKTKIAISNQEHLNFNDEDCIKAALGEITWSKWFEKEYSNKR